MSAATSRARSTAPRASGAARTPSRLIYQPQIPLWDEQKKGLARMRGREAFALLMAMRTGKTPTALADFGQLELEGKARDLLVIAPAGVYRTWRTAMEEHLSEDLARRLVVFVWESGMGKRARDSFELFMRIGDRPRALLMNVEALSRPGDAREEVRRFLGGLDPRNSVVVIDESTIIKNRSKRTQFINRFIRPLATYRRILSGLPTPRSPLDLYHQFEFLDPKILGFHTYKAFMMWVAFTEPRNFGGRWLATIINKEKGDNGYRPECVAELKRMIEPHSYRVEFRPKVPPTYAIREVEMTKEQARAYREMREFATTELAGAGHVTATVVIAQIMRMHQILMGHTETEQGDEVLIPENRTAALLEELENISGKAVIWFAYVGDLERCMTAIEAEYGPGSTARFYGGNSKTREEDERRFKTDPRCRFMGATAGAGGRGRTWPNADTVIYHSSTDDLEKRDQSEQRAHSRDKTIPVDYVDLIVRDTVEEKILQALRKKIDMASAINGDNYREWLL